MALELVLLVGLPASGKSSFQRERFTGSHVVVSKDLMPNNRNRERRQRHLIEEALAAGYSVVVDNVNASRQARAPLLEIGRRYEAQIIGYWFESVPGECMRRNATRIGRARVPPVAIFAAAKALEPPAYAEGFDQLYRVTLDAECRVEVAPLPQERK